MKKLSEIRVSKFKNLVTKVADSILMFEELKHIKLGTYKEMILNCRAALDSGNKALYTELKSNLPSVTFCGEFVGGHKVSNIIHYNNLMIIDIDNINNINELIETKERLKKDKYILSLWNSPSGRGLKCLVKIESDADKHKAVFNSLSIYFSENYQIELDKSGKDVSRLCFSSWDENMFYNSKSETYTELFESEKKQGDNNRSKKDVNIALSLSAFATEGLNKKKEREIITKIYKYLLLRKFSITDNYDNWIKVAFAISYSFSYDVGEKYFLNFCRLDNDKHDEAKSINLLKQCYNDRKIKLTDATMSLASIIYFAKQKGFENLKHKKNG
jgi:hypothetical protein